VGIVADVEGFFAASHARSRGEGSGLEGLSRFRAQKAKAASSPRKTRWILVFAFNRVGATNDPRKGLY
jgi:hypothetical protein